MRLGWWIAAVLLVGTPCGAQTTEIEFRHINDLFSASPQEDDLYTATVGLSATVRGWKLDLDEYLFTDKTYGVRFDETYLTVARDLLKPESKWGLRARVGVVRIGRGVHGQRLQNFVHRVLGQQKLNLPYVPDVESYGFFRVNLTRTLLQGGRTSVEALLEGEAAGFKGHTRVALSTQWDLGYGFELGAEGGVRFSHADFAPLSRWIHASEPTVRLGVGYKDFLEMAWTRNYFGTADNHWHLMARLPLRKRAQAGTAVSRTPFSPPIPLGR